MNALHFPTTGDVLRPIFFCCRLNWEARVAIFWIFRSELFVKYHEFNIMGQVSDLWCVLKYSAYVQFFIFSLSFGWRECMHVVDSPTKLTFPTQIPLEGKFYIK